MSDKGRKQEDRSGILKSVRGPGIPQLGAAPGLIHHPPYSLPSDPPHTLSLHPSHLAYPMMRPALGMGAPLPMSAGLPTKTRGNLSISNDLGPPIFMPSLNLGVPKQPSGQPPSPAIPGPNTKPKNSIAFSQSTMSSNFVADILSNTPAPFMPAFHVTAATSILRPGGQPTVYIPHSALHPSQNASLRPSPPQATTQQSPAAITVAKPTPIAATNPQKPGPSKTVTKVVSGNQQKPPGAIPSTVKQTLKSHTSYPVHSQSHVHSGGGGGTPPSAIAMATKPPTTSMSKTIVASSPDGNQPLATMGHMTYVTHAPIPHPHMVHTIPYMPHQGLVPHALPSPQSMGSTLSKMLLAPSQTTTRQPKPHMPTESPASHTHLPSPSTSKPPSLGGSTGGVAASLGSHNSASPKVGTPEGYSSRSLAQPTTSLSTSGQPTSSASYTDTRLERPPQPSAAVVPQSSAAVSSNFSNATYNAVPGKDRATCAEVASGIIITMPGLTGKHIAQITNSGTSGTPSPGSGAGSAQSIAGGSEGYRGYPQAMDAGPSVAQTPQANAVHLSSPSLTATGGGSSNTGGGGGGQVLNLHQNPAGSFAQQPAATAPVAMAMHPQAPSVGGASSPGQGNSSPRPRILRKLSYNRKMDSQATPTSPSSSSSSPLINKIPLAGTQKHISGITTPTDHTHPMYNSTSSVGQKRPASPSSGSGSEGHNHLKAELGDIMASPRKKPRKQNVVANDDQYASNVPDGIAAELLSGSPHSHPRVVGSVEEDHAPLLSMTTRSKTRAEEAFTKEAPKEVEFRYLAQLRQSPYPINGVYRNYHRAAHNHFRRHADIKHREEEQVSAYNIASNRSSWQRASGWKLLRLSQQLEEMSKVEAEILETMQRVMGSVHNLDQCASCPVDGKCLANFEEIIEGNVNRSSRVLSHIRETNATMLKVLDQKSHVTELLKKYSPPKKSVHSNYSAANSQKSRS